MEYRLATLLGSGEIVYGLDETALHVRHEKNGHVEHVPFSNVATINLRQELPGVFMTRIVRNVGAPIHIPSRHFRGVGQFETRRRAEYRAFVAALLARSHAANPRIHYAAGSTGLYWLGWVLIVGGAALALLFAAGLVFSSTAGAPPWRVLFAVPVAFLVGGGFVRQGRGSRYDPASPPEHLLPSA